MPRNPISTALQYRMIVQRIAEPWCAEGDPTQSLPLAACQAHPPDILFLQVGKGYHLRE